MSEEWHERLQKLSKDDLQLSQEILEHVRVMRRRLFWIQLISWVKLAIIAAPVILLLVWLPPKLKSIWTDYQAISKELEVLTRTTKNPSLLTDLFIEQLMKRLNSK
ncbi:hypothetical protein A3H75_02775 [Candidatus Uhrbacteria bacterium RIFCSPLOWO2_02_FULL_51_9]|uniref:Uncharacterized protein n=1 Tax=Candidatus Uhrbacteria bacterium RIFCSPLOWO2_02_FULL_51_9 TaxID=1802410 RepID=A0A1F7VFF5_9BACT|nr:MAG: hypothetical protein A3H75_02775 [Candidatus Uhrbacteria bacterium RIFCSPLOWO2_02_FULL_51_9]